MINESVEGSQEVNQLFKNITGILKEMDDKINAISRSTDTQYKAASEIGNTINEVAGTASVTASELEQITAEIQEQLTGFHIINSNIQKLTNMAKYLKENTDLFLTE